MDVEGAIGRVDRWPWSEAPAVGTPIAALFAPEAQELVRTLSSWGWVGVQEHALEAAVGIVVRIWAEPTGEGAFRLAMRDVSDLVVLRDMTEQRRIGGRLAELAGSLARDLSDPMSVLFGRLEFMLDLGDTTSRDVPVLYQNTRRMVAVLHNLRSVGRFPGPSLQTTAVAEALREALTLLGDLAQLVTLNVDEDLRVACERELVPHLVASLVWRALEMLGQVQLALNVRRDAGGVLFELRPDPAQEWNAAGVLHSAALVQILLASIGGSISAPDRPRRLSLTLPAPQTRPIRARRGDRSVLVVGAHIGAHVQYLLAHDPFKIVVAQGFDQALPLLDAADAVLTELVLEGRYSGRTLAELAVRRGLQCVVVADREIPPRALPRAAQTLRWPASREALLALLREGNARQR